MYPSACSGRGESATHNYSFFGRGDSDSNKSDGRAEECANLELRRFLLNLDDDTGLCVRIRQTEEAGEYLSRSEENWHYGIALKQTDTLLVILNNSGVPIFEPISSIVASRFEFGSIRHEQRPTILTVVDPEPPTNVVII